MAFPTPNVVPTQYYIEMKAVLPNTKAVRTAGEVDWEDYEIGAPVNLFSRYYDTEKKAKKFMKRLLNYQTVDSKYILVRSQQKYKVEESGDDFVYRVYVTSGCGLRNRTTPVSWADRIIGLGEEEEKPLKLFSDYFTDRESLEHEVQFFTHFTKTESPAFNIIRASITLKSTDDESDEEETEVKIENNCSPQCTHDDAEEEEDDEEDDSSYYCVGVHDHKNRWFFSERFDLREEAEEYADEINGEVSELGAAYLCYYASGTGYFYFWNDQTGTFEYIKYFPKYCEEYQKIALEEAEEEEQEEREMYEDAYDLTGMTLSEYGKGFILRGNENTQYNGQKYFLNGWWRPDLNAWFFKTEYVYDLIELGAEYEKKRSTTKKTKQSTKTFAVGDTDRTGITSNRLHWEKLERGWALVPKKNFKHYGNDTYRGGKWWKNGSAWFFTDNGRLRFISGEW